MEIAQVMALMEKAKELEIDELSYGDLTFKFKKPVFFVNKHDESKPVELNLKSIAPTIKTEVPPEDPSKAFKPASPLDDMSAEEILYYAVPYYDEIQAQKEARATELATEGMRP